MGVILDRLALMQTFLRVVEAGSFSAVATELDTSQPTVSRQVAALEAYLGARLLTRTTRALTLTQEGQDFYDYAKRAVDAVIEAEDAVRLRRARVTGLLRLACPVVFGRLHVAPRLARFLNRYPEVSVELIMNDGFTDLVEEGIDLAIRVGEIADPALVARRVGITRRLTAASPDYLAAKGEPAHPLELSLHDCIVYTRLATGNEWIFGSKERPVAVTVGGRYRANNSEGVREGIISGLGIGVVPNWILRDEIERGLAKIILRAFEPVPLPIHAVYPSRRFVPAKVRAMIDYLAHEFALDPQLSAEGG